MAPSAPRDLDDAGVAGEVVDHARFSAERVLEKVRDLFRERRIDLEERRPMRREDALEIRRRAPDELEAVLPRGHGEPRLVRERGALTHEMLERVVAQVRQVRDDDLYGIGDWGQQVALTQLDPIADAVAKRVLPRDHERVDADVGGDHVYGSFVGRDRDGHGARPGPDVVDGHGTTGDERARRVDESLRLRTWDQHAMVDGA